MSHSIFGLNITSAAGPYFIIMGRFLKAVAGFVTGAICGATAGAVMLAAPTYLDKSCGFVGCVKDWTPVAIYLGVIAGAVPGAATGFIVGVASLNKLRGAGAGASTGLVILIILLCMGAADDALVIGWGLASIPAGALIGLIVATLPGLGSVSKGNI
jgi:hypothetical protein